MFEKSIYGEWYGIKTVIPLGYPWMTDTGGARLSDEVVEVMARAARHKVPMEDLLWDSGEEIAGVFGAEAALITSGGCAALALAAAAVMTGGDLQKMTQLPDSDTPVHLRNELVVQTGMFDAFLNCFRIPGARLRWVGDSGGGVFSEFDTQTHKLRLKRARTISSQELEDALTERSAGLVAAVHCSVSVPPPYTVHTGEVVRIARRLGIPTIADVSHLPSAGGEVGLRCIKQYLEMGVDLLCMCGGKALEGPNDTGILCGRKDLVEAAAAQGAPGIFKKRPTEEEVLHRSALVGRGFKVSKEQVVGLTAAVRSYVERDPKAVVERDERICAWMASYFEPRPYVKTARVVPENEWPHDNMLEGGPSCLLEVDEEALGSPLQDLPRTLSLNSGTDVDISSCLGLASWGRLQLFSHGLRDGEEDAAVRALDRALSKHTT